MPPTWSDGWAGWLTINWTAAAGVTRSWVDPDHTATVGLSRISWFYAHLLRHDLVVANQDRGVRGTGDTTRPALLVAADADTGPQRLRSAAIARALLLNGLLIDEVAGADITDLGHDAGHRVLTVTRKGGRRTRVPLWWPQLSRPDP